MRRILPPVAAAIAACAPLPQEAAARGAGPVPDHPDRDTGKPAPGGQGPAADPAGGAAALARGRRVFSTAFVMIGPDGLLTVERRDGGVLVLRDVTMGPAGYGGVQVSGPSAGDRYRGGYADVVGARAGR